MPLGIDPYYPQPDPPQYTRGAEARARRAEAPAESRPPETGSEEQRVVSDPERGRVVDEYA